MNVLYAISLWYNTSYTLLLLGSKKLIFYVCGNDKNWLSLKELIVAQLVKKFIEPQISLQYSK